MQSAAGRCSRFHGLGVIAVVWACALPGQTIRGAIHDSVSKAPVPVPLITVLDDQGQPLRMITGDSSGRFIVTMPYPGTYTVDVRRLGYLRRTTAPMTLAANDTVTVALDMQPEPGVLNPMVVKGSRFNLSLTDVSAGREFFARHYALGKGVFAGGWEIQHSGKSLSEYLGTLPGVILGPRIASPNSVNPFRGWSPPAVPAANDQFLTTAFGRQCLYARVDRWSIFGLMVRHGLPATIDQVVNVANVMAVEVYRDIREVPKEWQTGAWIDRLIYVKAGGGYFLGDTGLPSLTLDTMELRAPSDTLPHPNLRATALAEQKARLKGQTPTLPWVGVSPYAVVDSQTALQMNTEFLAGGIPSCGFMQIWTKSAW